VTVFYALDVETANPDQSSICQIGIKKFVDGSSTESWQSLINPETYFDSFNSSIHGITEDDVSDAPTFSDVYDELNALLSNGIILHHGSFDRIAFQKVYVRLSLEPITCQWLDNTRVVRRAWEKYSRSGYGLKHLCSEFDINLSHHDALSDANAAGEIFCLALNETNTTPSDWLTKVNHPLDGSNYSGDVSRDGNPEGEFSGENIVFTGELQRTRAECSKLAASLGFNVQNNVTKKTTYLCVGIVDLSKLNGGDKTNKQKKVEALILQGHEIQILSESDFNYLIKEVQSL